MASVYIQTHGCAKNEADSRHMVQCLKGAGYTLVQRPSEADIFIINTCGFLEAATRESLEATLELAEGKGEKILVMAGCVPSRYKGDLALEMPEVDAFVEVLDEDNIVEVLKRAQGSRCASKMHNGKSGGQLYEHQNDCHNYEHQNDCHHHEQQNDSHYHENQNEAGWAYVKISDGCNRFCSFCTIPYIRGRYASRPHQEICDEIEDLLKSGLKEVVLVGQDTGIYGIDFSEKAAEPKSLAQLIRILAPLFKKYAATFRILYIQPDGVNRELIDAFLEVDELVNYFDIPIQHTNERILKAMGRKGSQEEYRSLFSAIRMRIPEATLRTTAMVGFPGEAEEDFENLLSFIDEVGFDYVSPFAYSREEPAKAAYFENQVPEEIKRKRLQKLVDKATLVGERKMAAHVGETVDVLITAEEDGQSIGRAWFQAPDSDGVITFGNKLLAGKVFSATLTRSQGFDFEGTAG